MKKVISVLLALLCLCFTLTPAVFADEIKDTLSEEFGLELEDPKAYGIVYQSGDAKTMYMPATTVMFDGPGYCRVSEDYPIAIGKNFRCWKDENGKDVFPGDEIYVGTITYLTASWSASSSNVTAFDTVICALKTMIHMIRISINVINTANEFRSA